MGCSIFVALAWALIANRDAGVTLGYSVVALIVVILTVWLPTTTWAVRLLDTSGFTAFRWVRTRS